MPTYTIRSVISWDKSYCQKKKFVYEERITAWNADSIDTAIELAENEAQEYASDKGFEALDLFQAFWLFDEINIIPQGAEMYSLLRESDLEADTYLNTFFDTGDERGTEYGEIQDYPHTKNPPIDY